MNGSKLKMFSGHIIKDSVYLVVTGKPDEKKEKGGDKADDKVRKKLTKPRINCSNEDDIVHLNDFVIL